MNDTFWGLALLALAVVVSAVLIGRGLRAIAQGLEMRNAALARMRMPGARVAGISGKAHP